MEAAYGQLEAEGYLARRVGQGSFVAARFARPPTETVPPLRTTALAALSQRGHQLVRGGGCSDPLTPFAFAAGSPDLRVFPHDTWRQLCNQRLRHEAATLAGYGDPQGYAPLRMAIAAYLHQACDVRGSADQVLVLTSSQQALHLLGSLLLDEGDVVWMEEPAYRGARTALAATGARLVPVPVDGEGMCPSDDLPLPRLIYLTPSHQYPTGCALSLSRRQALLEIARKQGCWIIEDDYDSEFHFDGRPHPAMQGLDRHDRVIYLGTFSKALFPSLRLAYAMLPAALLEPAITVRTLYDGHSNQLMQAVTADFINRGHFATHLRYMRQLYRSRRDLLLDEITAKLSHLLRIHPSPGGLQVLVELPPGSETRLTRQAQAVGVATPGLQSLYLTPPGRDGWLLGFAALSMDKIRAGVHRLQVLRADLPFTD
ncbi:PLP-dependent aminotransferase family protein [Chitinimonas sp. BJB300]|uniref:MocR-like pyridoxine biosynthesis transcription factor PdxR n=1 Tax=Chitinimonas sp. BJB300 TaxID=1559339 RepID=UPI0018ED48E2|nr:PLP-dependent aminotransferase family protein [Chitinimonas sp. BJB300]